MLGKVIKRIAAIYIRVSTEDQKREGHSLDTQLEDCQGLIRRDESLVEGTIYKEVESGHKIDREQYQQMLRDAQAGKFQVLVIWKIDRFMRNTLEGLRAVEFLMGLGIEIMSPTEYLDFVSARGKRNMREDLVGAEFERDRLIERVMPGMKRGVAKGHWQGARSCFYGYRYDKRDKLLIEVPEEIKVVKIIYSLRSQGMAIYSLCMRLAEMGIRNRMRRLFTTRQIEIILNRAIYYDGHLLWNGVRSEQPVMVPILDKDIWEKVQAVNADRKQETKNVSPGRATSSYVLQGVLKCALCGGNMVGQRRHSNRPKNIKVPWYVCGTYIQRTRKACPGQCVRADAVHELAFDILKKILRNPQLIEFTRDNLKKMFAHSFPHLSRRVNDLQANLQRLKREEAKCRDAYYREALTLQQFKNENYRLLEEQRAAEEESRDLQTKLSGAVAYEGKIDQVFSLLSNFEPVWKKMDPVQQRVVYRGIFNTFFTDSRKYSREYKVKDFSLKEPFKSWYYDQAWGGPILITEAGGALLIDNQIKNKDLCEKFIFAPSDVK